MHSLFSAPREARPHLDYAMCQAQALRAFQAAAAAALDGSPPGARVADSCIITLQHMSRGPASAGTRRMQSAPHWRRGRRGG